MQDEQQTNEENEIDEIKPIIEESDLERPDYIFIPKGNHIYRQQGFYLVCQSCDLSHAVFIGKDKIMVGIKDGEAILKTRKELGIA